MVKAYRLVFPDDRTVLYLTVISKVVRTPLWGMTEDGVLASAAIRTIKIRWLSTEFGLKGGRKEQYIDSTQLDSMYPNDQECSFSVCRTRKQGIYIYSSTGSCRTVR